MSSRCEGSVHANRHARTIHAANHVTKLHHYVTNNRGSLVQALEVGVLGGGQEDGERAAAPAVHAPRQQHAARQDGEDAVQHVLRTVKRNQ